MNIDKLGSIIREKRKKADLTYRELGELAGISHNEVGMIERAKRKKPGFDVITSLCTALKIDVNWLLVEIGIDVEEELISEEQKKKIAMHLFGGELNDKFNNVEDVYEYLFGQNNKRVVEVNSPLSAYGHKLSILVEEANDDTLTDGDLELIINFLKTIKKKKD